MLAIPAKSDGLHALDGAVAGVRVVLVTGADREHEKCGGTMKIVSALAAPAQDDVIRTILESTGQWDPLWNRRAPPLERHATGSHPAEPIVEYEVDPDLLWPEG